MKPYLELLFQKCHTKKEPIFSINVNQFKVLKKIPIQKKNIVENIIAKVKSSLAEIETQVLKCQCSNAKPTRNNII